MGDLDVLRPLYTYLDRIDAGDIPELARAKHVDLADIDSGHWPMITKPAELARILATAADAADG